MHYLAGPYSINPEAMFERHMDAAERLFSAGYTVYSPILETHQWHQKFPHDYDWWLERDLEILGNCQGVIRLPGESPGADKEVEFARMIGLPVWAGMSPVEDFIEKRPPTIARDAARRQLHFDGEMIEESILDEAKRLTGCDRNQDYGHPADDFVKVVGAINALWAHKLREPLTIRDWPMMMVVVKLAREIHKPKRDNRVDGAGYFECLDRVDQRERANV